MPDGEDVGRGENIVTVLRGCRVAQDATHEK